LVAPRGEGRKSGEQRSRSSDLVVKDELSNPRTSCYSSHGISTGTGGKTAKEMVRTTILFSRIMDSHTSNPWRRRLFYCSHRDGTCSVELKTLNGDQTGGVDIVLNTTSGVPLSKTPKINEAWRLLGSFPGIICLDLVL
jgi:hypothetical protein